VTNVFFSLITFHVAMSSSTFYLLKKSYQFVSRSHSVTRRLSDWSGDLLGGTGHGLSANNICVGAWMLRLLTVTPFEILGVS
jgi:hypothetical protein